MKANMLTLALCSVLAALPVVAVDAASLAPPRTVSAADSAKLSQAMADLGLALLRDQAPGANSMNSPYSVSNALGMVLLGAAGDSAQQLARLLQGGSTRADLLASYMGAINPALTRGTGPASLHNANRLWLNSALTRSILPSYARQTLQYYQSDAVLQSFDKPELAVPPINAWIADQTGGKIANMLTPAQLPPSTQMVLVNAVYFKGLWRTRFLPEATRDADFTPADGKAVQVPTMRAIVQARTAQQGGAQWLELPYGSEASESGWVMQIALPAPGQSLAQFQQQLTGAQWHAAMAQLQAEKLEVALPRFSMKGATSSLRESLRKLGVVDIFSTKADLSGINGGQNLLVDDVFHRATVEVDEAGTVAAAATAAVVGVKSAPMFSRFAVDRPFLFFIVHTPTQTPVFVGRVMNPASGS